MGSMHAHHRAEHLLLGDSRARVSNLMQRQFGGNTSFVCTGGSSRAALVCAAPVQSSCRP